MAPRSDSSMSDDYSETDLVNDLSELLLPFSIELSTDQLSLMVRHLHMVNIKNQTINLTRIEGYHDGLIRHVVDSLLYLPCIRSFGLGQDDSFIDLGTGAGFPGIPLGIATDLEGLLIDSVGKKAMAVQEFVDALGLDGRLAASHERIEDHSSKHPSSVQLVVARAVGQSGILVEYASPVLDMGGHLVISKGHLSSDEFDHSIKVAKLCGMKIVSRETYELPESCGHREIIAYEKVKQPSIKLPRKPGMATAKPL